MNERMLYLYALLHLNLFDLKISRIGTEDERPNDRESADICLARAEEALAQIESGNLEAASKAH
jgi:hypothetical protein